MPIFSPPHILNSPRWKNMRIGILGGSFNPAHEGHVHISEIALKSLKLDAIWWLITPRNPLKTDCDLKPMDERVTYAQKLLDNNPKIIVTDIEKHLGTKYSYDSIRKLKKHYPNTEFAWITGMDNAHSLHLWNNWKELLDEICMVHIARDKPDDLVKKSPARMVSSQKYVVLNRPEKAELTPNATYLLLQETVINVSSTKIREITLIKDKKSI